MRLKIFLFFLIFNYTAKAQKDPELFPLNDRKVGQLGYYLSDGTNIVKPQFCSASYQTDGYYMVSKADHEYDEAGNRKENHILGTEKFGLLDSKGNFIIGYNSNYDLISVHHNLIEVGKNQLYGIVNDKNKVIIPLIYSDFHIQNKHLIIATKNGKKGILAKDNTIIIPFVYDELYSFKENKAKNNFYAVVAVGNKKGVIDKNNKFIIPLTGNDIQFVTEKLIGIKKDKKFRLVDFTFKPIFDHSFDVLYLVDVDSREIYGESEGFGYYMTLYGKVLKKEKLDKGEKSTN